MEESQKVAQLLSSFEKQKSHLIGQFEYKGLNMWPHVKTSLYFALIRGKSPELNKDEPKRTKLSLFSWGIKRIRILSDFTLLLIRLIGKRRRIFFLAYSVDKIKMNDGIYVNQIIDGFAKNNNSRKQLYSEIAYNGDLRTPSVIPIDIVLDRYLLILPIIMSLLSKRTIVFDLSQKLRKSLLEFFKGNEIFESLETKSFDNIVLEFLAEYYFYYAIFAASKPRIIITSEKTGKALIAASSKLGLKSIDLQHGVIDRFHPQYIYDESLKGLKKSLGIPTYVGVFGGIHKKLMLENNFWNDGEIEILGSYRMERMRAHRNSDHGLLTRNENWILIPAQWNIFESVQYLVSNLNHNLDSKFRIILKMHPLELTEHEQVYGEIALKSNGKIVIAGKDDNTYSLIESSLVVIGFDSAVLLEAVSLGKPVITISTQSLPRGILGYYDDRRLNNAIKHFCINETDEIVLLLERAISDSSFYSNWVLKCKEEGDYLYAQNYSSNCKALVEKSWN